jgi:hypothetical protein
MKDALESRGRQVGVAEEIRSPRLHTCPACRGSSGSNACSEEQELEWAVGFGSASFHGRPMLVKARWIHWRMLGFV